MACDVPVRPLSDWYFLRHGWYVTSPGTSTRCSVARRLRTSAALAAAWAREALA